MSRPRLTREERKGRIAAQAKRETLRKNKRFIPGTRSNKLVEANYRYLEELEQLIVASKARATAKAKAAERAKYEAKQFE